MNPFGEGREVNQLVWNASRIARAHNPELAEKEMNDPVPGSGFETGNVEYPEEDLEYSNPLVGPNPALLKVAGKTSSNISRERNKNKMFDKDKKK